MAAAVNPVTSTTTVLQPSQIDSAAETYAKFVMSVVDFDQLADNLMQVCIIGVQHIGSVFDADEIRPHMQPWKTEAAAVLRANLMQHLKTTYMATHTAAELKELHAFYSTRTTLLQKQFSVLTSLDIGLAPLRIELKESFNKAFIDALKKASQH
jgi:hypothetical protein